MYACVSFSSLPDFIPVNKGFRKKTAERCVHANEREINEEAEESNYRAYMRTELMDSRLTSLNLCRIRC